METKKDENLMPEEKKTNRQIWEEAIKGKNPEADFSDEDVLYDLSMKGYDEEHEYRKNNEQKNKEMYDLLSANPDVAMFISSLVTDKNVGKAMSYLSDVIGLQEGTPEYEEYQNGVEARKTREAEAQKAVEEYENNLKESADVLKAFADENGCLPEEASPTDGMHFGPKYYEVWFEYLKKHVANSDSITNDDAAEKGSSSFPAA